MNKETTKKLAKILLSAGCLLTLCSIGGASAHADTASSGGHAGGGGNSNGYWRNVTWNHFASWNNTYRYYDGVIGHPAMNRTLDKCKGKRVSFLTWGPKGHRWTSTARQSNRAGGIENIPKASLAHAKKHGWEKGSVTIICQWKKPKPWKYTTEGAPAGYNNYSSYQYTSNDSDSFDLTGVYTTSTQLSPEKPDEYGSWSPSQQRQWDSTHMVQNSGEVRNGWSDFIDSLSQGSIDLNNARQSADSIKARSAQLQQGNYWTQPKITMNATNRKGFAQGGVFDTTEFHKVMTYHYNYNTTTTWTQPQTCPVTFTGNKVYKYKEGKPKQLVSDTVQQHNQPCYNSGAPQKGNTTGFVNLQKTSPDTPYSYWQMINTRCNKAKFDELTKSIDGFVNDSGSSDYGSEVGHTRKYLINGDTPFDNRPLGNDNKGGILGETAHQAFYENTQSCKVAIDCFSEKQPGNKYTQVNNASKDNVSNTGTNARRNGQAVYGAQADGNSSDAFTFFRDGKTHEMRTDLWYPRAYSGEGIDTNMRFEPATFTRMYFDPSGTPTGSFFTMGINPTEYNGSPDGASEDPAHFVNGNDIANGLSKFAKGELTHFYPRSTWTSDSDNPERFNIDWTWKPDITNKVYTNINGNAPTSTDGTDKSKIYVTCPISMDTTDTHKPIIQNNMDSTAPLQPLSSFDSSNGKSVSMGFVRSTASR